MFYVLCYGQFSLAVGTEVANAISAVIQATKLVHHMDQDTVAIMKEHVTTSTHTHRK